MFARWVDVRSGRPRMGDWAIYREIIPKPQNAISLP